MDNLDFIDLQTDEEFEILRLKMEDAAADEWITSNARTINKYIAFRILEELEDIERIANKDNDPVPLDQTLTKHILRLVEIVKQ